jgi:hypothetical protein
MDAQISSLLRAAEHRLHDLASPQGARSPCERTASCRNSSSFSLGDIDMLLWIRHLSLTAAPRREKSGSLEFRSVQRRNTDGEEESEKGRQEA